MCVPTPVFLLSSTVQTPASTALPTAPVSRLFAPMSALLFWREAVYTDRYKYSTTVSTMFTATGAETETCGCCCWSWWCNFLILNWTDLNWTSSTINLVTNFHCRHSLSSPETSWFSKWAVLLLTKSKHRSPETAEDQAKTSHLLQAHVVAVGRNFSRRLSDVKWNPAGVWFKARSVNKGAVCWTTFRRTTKHPSSPIPSTPPLCGSTCKHDPEILRYLCGRGHQRLPADRRHRLFCGSDVPQYHAQPAEEGKQ